MLAKQVPASVLGVGETRRMQCILEGKHCRRNLVEVSVELPSDSSVAAITHVLR